MKGAIALAALLTAGAGELPHRQIQLSSLFDETEARAEVTNEGMTVVREHANNVVVARVADDGTIVTSCVTTKRAVQAIMKNREIAGETSRKH